MRVVSTVTNQTMLPKTTEVEISTRDLDETGNAFRPWLFNREWVNGIGTLSVRVPELRLEDRDHVSTHRN